MQEVTLMLDVPEGYEATGEYRSAMPGDMYLSCEGPQVSRTHTLGRYPILRKVHWNLPMLKEGLWYAVDQDGSAWVYTRDPILSEKQWQAAPYSDYIRLPATVFDLPHFADWRKSKRQIIYPK